MRPIYPLVGGAMLAACLAGWVALAWGQPQLTPLQPVVPAVATTPPAPTLQLPAEGKGNIIQVAVPPAPPGPAPMPFVVPPSSAIPAPPATVPPPMMSPSVPSTPPLPVEAPTAPPATEVKTPTPPESTVGRQEPAVSIEWVGPQIAKIGVTTEYLLIVRNTGATGVRDVKVNLALPTGMRLSSAEPRPDTDGVWTIGALESRQEKALQLKLIAESRGDLTPAASVSFTAVASLRVKVREPKLVVKATAPEMVMVGDSTAFTITVNNPGDGPADQVKIRTTLSDGLEHARGPKVDFEIGTLGAGETRSVQVICQAKFVGTQKCEAVAGADGGLVATDLVQLNVVTPRLDLQISGPGLRYLERKALYTIKITNPGDASATNVTVGDVVPAGFKVLAASHGGRHDYTTRTVSWFLGEIGPGQTREVQLEVQAITAGKHTHRAIATGARGLRADSELITSVEGLSALGVELVDTEDPVEVNGETAYEIKISNTGSKTETDIKLIVDVPPQMQFKNATGPTRHAAEGARLVFEPIATLAPRVDAVYRINVKALEAGTVRFKIQVTSTNLVEPVIKMEATRIYSDAPEPKSGH